MYKLRSAALAVLVASLCLGSWARADEDSEKLDNPKPLADDISLPLPCEGEMVFRAVYVLARGTLDDREISLGYPFSEDEPGYKQSFISGYRRDFINGQFTLKDLPDAWQKSIAPTLPKTDADSLLKPMFISIRPMA